MTEQAEMKEPPHIRQVEHCRRMVAKDDTNMKILMAEYDRLSKLNPDDNIFKSPACYCFTEHRSVNTRPHNRVTLNDLIKAPNSFHRGRFFLCRTVTPSIKIHSLLAVVESPDPSMKNQGALVSLGNYIPPLDEKTQIWDSFLSPGTIILVKNPLFFKTEIDSYYTIKCDNPSDVVILEMEKFSRLFPKLRWPSRKHQSEEKSLLIKPRWCWSKPIKDWNGIAELRLEKKNFRGALEAYQYAVGSNPRDIESFTLRSALYFKLKVYHKALKDSKKILEVDKGNKKAIYSKALSLIGLGRYDCAIQFLERHLDKCRFSLDAEHEAELSKIVSKAKTWNRQEKFGEYDIVDMFKRPSTFIHDCADYRGSVRKQDIAGKGKGVVASVDIKYGELLVAEKAFAMVCSDDEKFNGVWVYNSQTKEFQISIHQKLVASVAHRLLLDPNLGRILYRLYDGKERSVSKPIEDVEDGNCVDMIRIRSICRLNAFAKSTCACTYGNDASLDGLWIFASYFNHSCYDANSICSLSGNVMFIRACRSIKKNEELTISYVSCYTPYPKRLSFLSKYGFVCKCTLCQLDSKDSNAIHLRREQLLAEINDIGLETYSQRLPIEKHIEALKGIRHEDPKLNICVHEPLKKLAKCFVKGRDYEHAARIYSLLHDLTFGTVLNKVSLMSCCHCIVCYLNYGNVEEASKCVGDLKSNLMKTFGTDSKELLKFYSEDLSSLLTLYGVDH